MKFCGHPTTSKCGFFVLVQISLKGSLCVANFRFFRNSIFSFRPRNTPSRNLVRPNNCEGGGGNTCRKTLTSFSVLITLMERFFDVVKLYMSEVIPQNSLRHKTKNPKALIHESI